MTQATTLLESTRATIPQLQIGLQQAQNALSTLLGQPTGTVEALLAGPTGIPVAPAEVAVSVPAELLRRRPDIRSAELDAVAQCARIGVAKADLYPSFSLFGSIGTQTSSGAAAASVTTCSTPAASSTPSGPGSSGPSSTTAASRTMCASRTRGFSSCSSTTENTVLKAAQEVEDAHDRLPQVPGGRGVRSRTPPTSAQRSVDLAFVQYREGAVDYQRVLDAQRSLLQEQNTLAQTRSADRHEPDRPLQGPGRRLGAAPGPARRAGQHAASRWRSGPTGAICSRSHRRRKPQTGPPANP